MKPNGKRQHKSYAPSSKRIVSISTALRKVKTVEDLLARDDVNAVLQELDDTKPNISDMVVIWLDKRDDTFYYEITKGTLVSTATWLLESTKIDLLSE